MPSDLESPIYLDMATSSVSNGKVAVAAARGEQIPEGFGEPAMGPISTGMGLILFYYLEDETGPLCEDCYHNSDEYKSM